jgi:hypothetical protein
MQFLIAAYKRVGQVRYPRKDSLLVRRAIKKHLNLAPMHAVAIVLDISVAWGKSVSPAVVFG